MKVKTIKTEELNGAALDWAVAKCEGWGDWDSGEPCEEGGFFSKNGDYSYALFICKYSPSTDWAQGGPIIEREHLNVKFTGKAAAPWVTNAPTKPSLAPVSGPTPLIAAMRCYVASEMGDSVEVPDAITA